MQIGIKLKQLRQHQQLTQADVADQLKLSRKTISSWENDRSYPDVASLITLSNIYHVTVDELLKGDQSMINHLTDIDRQSKRTKRVQGYYYWLNILFLIANIPSLFLIKSLRIPEAIAGIVAIGWVVLIITMLVSLLGNTESIKTKTVIDSVIIFVLMVFFVDPFFFKSSVLLHTSDLNSEAFQLGRMARAFVPNLSVILAILARPSYLRFGRHN
ncbi:helix-turn-helix domain-containing protein [Furfurilactobacillus rossiae]|uniref:helix-turn-helix domain-containing protein n=1 Tax=Furfurilactobacillus rossiae TaxID=231049 RepID=UPI001F3AF1F0|nr:helix-turn-helix transcriptional regulator [Furfurilactobacillus rossiae]MCF6165622.1 helix-turn-helix domain-containing protein [Furfurilactobacillus rossiae]